MKIQNPQITAQSLPKESPLRQAAENMEANFINELIKNMRNTVGESEEDKSNRGLQIFRGMLDEEYSQKAAKSNGIGLADLIVRQVIELEQSSRRAPGPVPVREVNENDLIKK